MCLFEGKQEEDRERERGKGREGFEGKEEVQEEEEDEEEVEVERPQGAGRHPALISGSLRPSASVVLQRKAERQTAVL